MGFVGLIDVLEDKFFKPEISNERLVSGCFRLDREAGFKTEFSASIFRVACDSDEPEVAAAIHQVKTESVKLLRVLRIYRRDLRGSGLSAVPTPDEGTTGIMHIDKLHYTLKGGKEGFSVLIARIRIAAIEGEDRVRRIWSTQINRQGERFLMLSPPAISVEALARCRQIFKPDPN
ncbi:MAG: hypothetical protein O7H41_16090 [Planctomycetota bacterium]|nr:hypothetical protein [Planctomycetota bacterium]